MGVGLLLVLWIAGIIYYNFAGGGPAARKKAAQAALKPEVVAPGRIRLPEISLHVPIVDLGADGRLTVKSKTSKGVTYDLDLTARTCTCPSFVERHAAYPPDTLRRPCKHLRDEMYKTGLFRGCDAFVLQLAMDGWLKSHVYRAEMRSGRSIFVAYDPGHDWIDVHARQRMRGEKDGNYSGLYERYGFSLPEQRWSYGDGPAGAREIRDILHNAGFPVKRV